MERIDTWFEAEYANLRAVAAKLCASERRGHTLNPTALVNEAYVTLTGSMATRSPSEPRYLHASLIRAMKRTLIDYARSRNCLKRGGGTYKRIPLEQSTAVDLPRETLDQIDLDEFTHTLESRNSRAAAVFRIRLHTGLRFETIATRLGVSRRTVTSDWNYAASLAHRWNST